MSYGEPPWSNAEAEDSPRYGDRDVIERNRIIAEKSAEIERLRHMNKALLAVAKRYAPAEHAAFCACVYDPSIECDCGFRAAHATIEAADQPS